MRFKRWTFSWKSPLLGFHIGENPVSGQRFVHIAPVPFVGLDFNLPPYDLNDAAREQLAQAPGNPADWQNDGIRGT